MRNDAIVRGLEKLTDREVFRSDCPELMGAFGCALYAKQTATTRVTEPAKHDAAGTIHIQAGSMSRM